MPGFSVDNLLAADRPHHLKEEEVETEEISTESATFFGTFIEDDDAGIPSAKCSNLLNIKSDFSHEIRQRASSQQKCQEYENKKFHGSSSSSSIFNNNIFPSAIDGIFTSNLNEGENGGEKKRKQQQQQPNCPTTTLFSSHQWAAMMQQCLQLQQAAQIMLANGSGSAGGGAGGSAGGDGGRGFGEYGGDQQQKQQHQNQQMAAATNPLMLQPPLALAAGTAFPLFQHMQKTKRIRTAFSPAQLVQLEHTFRRSQYLVGSERKQLAKQLMLSETQVKVWFQNRRTKSKRFVVDMDGDGDGAMSPGNCCSSSELMNQTPLSSMEEHRMSSE